MCQLKIITVALFTILYVLSVKAQSNTTPTCQTVTGMSNVNATLFKGDWYESIRAPAANVSCLKLNVNVINNATQLNITTNYSASRKGFLMDKYAQASVNISQVNANVGFNISYSNTKVNTTYKILSTDYNSYAVLCGYTNLNDPATSFGVILTRNQILNMNWLMELKVNASEIIPVFNSSTAANVTQSKSCRTNSAETSVPALATLFAAFYALLKLAY